MAQKPTMKLKPLTPEEKEQNAIRAFMQKREQIATGILYNICGNGIGNALSAEYIGKTAVKIADEFLQALYGKKEEDE